MDAVQLRNAEHWWHPAYGWRECPRCREPFPHAQRVPEMWLEVPLDTDWCAALRLAEQEGRIVVAELRVFPNEPARRTAGRWSAEMLGADAPVPVGGLPSRTVRKVRLTEVLTEVVPDLFDRWNRLMRGAYVGDPREYREPLAPSGMVSAARRSYRRRRAASASDVELARLAARYVELCRDRETSRAPRKALADERGEDSSRVRDLLTAARDRGLLTSGGKGRAGGALTAEARELLDKDRRQQGRQGRQDS